MEIGARENQEDAIRIQDKVIQKDHYRERLQLEGEKLLFVVCDGMGGHAYGELASLWTAEHCSELLKAKSPQEAQETLFALQLESEKELPENTGTTIAFCLITPEKIITGNAGDSRVYGVSQNHIFPMSHDHSVVQEMIDDGIIRPEDARRHPARNQITLGIGPAFRLEWKSPKRAFAAEFATQRVDYVLLCSDGLTDNVDDQEILEHIQVAELDAPELLYERAAEGTIWLDNTSIILIRIR